MENRENSMRNDYSEKMRRSPAELLESSIRDWGLLHGKRLTEEALRSWMAIFMSVEPVVLSVALERLTKEAERMPTPGSLTKAIAAVRLEKGINTPQQGEKQCRCERCKGTGFEIVATQQEYAPGAKYEFAKKCPCHEAHAINHAHINAVDPSGISCWIDSRTGEYEYRPTDCPEGRLFLATLAQVAGIPADQAAKYLEKWSTGIL